jgi:L-lactate dehydrogenase complex protein LldG
MEKRMSETMIAVFSAAAEKVGAEVRPITDVRELAHYIAERVDGTLLLSPCNSLERAGIPQALVEAGIKVVNEDFRTHGVAAVAGLTGANYGLAATGTVVLESTPEAVRIASTLPEKHFVVLDSGKILADAEAGVPVMRTFHEQLPQAYLAYLTGPSRTADIERVLTIGVHGPKELHVLLMAGVSDDPLER